MREALGRRKQYSKENVEETSKTNLNKQKGITLIALAVTIVVLLILAGITINMLFGSDGLFNISNQAKERYEIGALKDKINNVIADWSIERLTKPGITVDDLWDKMVEADIITDPETDVEGPEKEGENDVYQVTTNEGYVVEVIVMPDGSVVIGDAVKGDKLPPKIVSVETTSGTNNIQLTVTMNRWENGTISYYYKKDGEEDSSYKTFKENTTELTANIEGLEQNVVYNIKIVAENENGSTEKVVNETTGELKEGTVKQKGPTVWTNGTASIELETTETGVTIQYQIDTMERQWIDYEGPITGLNHNQTVYAVITDGNNISGHTSIDILDEEGPNVTVSKGTVTTNSVQVSVNSSDAQWGMPESITYNYYIKTSAGSYKADPDYTGTETSYTFTGLTQNTSYDVKVTTTDKARNPGEGQATNITTNTVGGASEDLREGNIIASEPTWQNGIASITLSKGTGVSSAFTIQYQIGGIEEGNWKNVPTGANSVTVTGLQHSHKVYARLSDGVNTGSYASVDILDKLLPQSANIQINGGTSTTTTGSITATVTHTDNESGVDIANCRWVYNTNATKIGTEASSYPNKFNSNGEQITLKANTPGTYYLHVLTVDKGENVTETVSEAITLRQLVTGITLNQTSATITEGETLQLTATVTPNNASNKTLKWSSNNTGVATVSTNGLVTAKTPGTATITVEAQDGSNKTATCSVTVNKKPATNVNELEAGDYVIYVDGTGVTRGCVVLYDSSSPYGVEIITMETVEDVTLGNSNFNTSMNSYNNAISTLNNVTSKYINTTYVDKARSVGSVPNNPNSQSGYYTFTEFSSSYSGKLRDIDTNYETDLDQMKALNINDIDEEYWLASRKVISNSSVSNFNVRSVRVSGSVGSSGLCSVHNYGGAFSGSYAYGLRPIFHLRSNIKVTGGTGEKGDPYTLVT